ncbi:hypothetical protein A3K86_05600 [Photobacterium jeanii]|uniref:Uncharacterized protein n=1 Tax=Photobacterium jeanii TaxID=858640 RepID=A0A178KM71_9GAMM|nr:hypothetical protein [Photobacterium jeanii]OAN18367.1 hypothetical protein A3K86_05600 [Photobacterium jeanii]PST91951.1 hypothetical protein C9I91_01870 [Photobacterium jeanii]
MSASLKQAAKNPQALHIFTALFTRKLTNSNIYGGDLYVLGKLLNYQYAAKRIKKGQEVCNSYLSRPSIELIVNSSFTSFFTLAAYDV